MPHVFLSFIILICFKKNLPNSYYAINRAKSTDGDKIREALVATDMPGETTIMPWKRVKFDEMGQNNDADPVLLQYTGGKFVTIFPPQAAVAEAVWPMK